MREGLRCYAVVLPGLEAVAARELAALGAREPQPTHGGIEFRTSPAGLMRIGLRARVPTRLLLRLSEFRALSFPELFNKACRLPWELYLRRAGRCVVRAEARRSRLLHRGRIEATLAQAIARRLRTHGRVDARPDQLCVHVRVRDDVCQLSLDACGERLDRRGYRRQPGKAPLRETLAAGLLQWADWRAEQPLCVPMCGSGTLAIEAALRAAQCAPGLAHVFPFIGWPGFSERRWRQARARAEAMRRPCAPRIHASDREPQALAWTRANAAMAGVAQMLRIEQRDFFTLEAMGACGLIVLNPPYGVRIGGDARALYARIGRHLARYFPGWRCVVLAPDEACVRALHHSPERTLRVHHGGRWVHAALFTPGGADAA